MKKENKFESVKLKVEIVDKVRKSKAKTGVPLATFFEQAAEDRLKKLKQ